MAPTPPHRIALLGLHLESNAFAPVSTEADFRSLCYLAGEEITAEAAKPHPAMPMEMAAFIGEMHRAAAGGAPPWQPVPILLAAAEPGGPVDAGFLRATLAEMEHRLQAAMPLDGVYISNHGAMCATDSLDPDGELFAMVRGVVGPNAPIVATLDLHANISERMVEQVDVLIAYRKNPHTDQVERGTEAAQTLRELLGGVHARTAFVPLPLVPVQTSLLTAEGPYAELIDYGQAHKGPEVLNVSVLGGFSYGDTPKQGISVVVTARDDPGPAQALAKELAARAWESRRRFTRTLTPLDEAVALAVRLGEDVSRPPVILADVSDNPGGGGRGNTPYLLEALYRAGARGVLLGNMYDPPLAAEAHRLDEGASFQAAFNREETHPLSPRISLPARVAALADGPIVGRRGIYAGRSISLGPCCALEVGGVTVVVGSRRKQCADAAFFERFGLDVGAARCVVVKSRGHFRAGFDEWFPPERVVEVDAPGLTTQNLFSLPYRNLDKAGRFPFDPQATWNPPDWVRR